MPEDSPFRSRGGIEPNFVCLPAIPAGRSGCILTALISAPTFGSTASRLPLPIKIAGTFRVHELNVSDNARAGEINTLAVEVFPALPDDLGWT